MQSEINNILSRVKKNDPKAQKTLYDKYAPLFYGICLRYMKNKQEAEDVLVESFYRIFSKIDQYNNKGSFEGWMKRIVINSNLMQIRKNINLNLHVDIENAYHLKEDATALTDLQHEELLELMDELPNGYRTVFNLYIIEGYKHREIAEKLDISINTSKSQLILAKKRMQELYKKKHKTQLKSS
jgi:RNA polymerase sigma-70 factor (ECF subfamily)